MPPEDRPPLRSQRAIRFLATHDARRPWAADVDGVRWTVRVNEFPEEPSLYSLMVDEQIVEELMDWPAAWTRLPSTPVFRGGSEERELYGSNEVPCTACHGLGEYTGVTGDDSFGTIPCGTCGGSGQVTVLSE